MPVILAAVLLVTVAGSAIAFFGSRSQRDEPSAVEISVQAESEITPERPDTAPQGAWIEWRADESASTYRIGGYEISLRPVVVDGLNAARMRVASDDGLSTEVTGQALSWEARADFAVVQLDERAPERQILFSSFSGGAHCCTSLIVLEVRDGDWRELEVGVWDGDTPALPTDLDGDGVKEFRSADQAFLYAFDSYAGSWAPTVIMSWREGRVREVSGEARFRPVHRRNLPELREACSRRANGACAAYVATAARLGELDQAWAFMLRSYDQASDWRYPTACRVRTPGQCPPEAEFEFATFPEALQWFLGEIGYTAPSYVEPLGARGPSFACGAARKASEQAICASTELSTLDRTLARAYTRAHALTADRGALRQSQRAFLSARDAASDDVEMAGLYIERIRQLAAV